MEPRSRPKANFLHAMLPHLWERESAKGGSGSSSDIITPISPLRLRLFSIREVEIQNQDKMRMVLRVSQFHVYANYLRGVGTEPRHQESVSQSIPSITMKAGCHGN